MEALPTLIKLNQRQLDEGRKHLADLERTRDALHAHLQDLDAEIAIERAAAGGPDGARTFMAWLEVARGRRDTLNRSIVELEEAIVAQQDAVAEAFQALKRVQLLDERQRARARAAEDRRQQAELDEMALSIFRRDRGEGG